MNVIFKWTKNIIIVIISIILIVFMCLGVFFSYKYYKENIANEETTENVSNNIEIVKETLETTAELNTGIYLFTDIITYEDSKDFKNWNVPFTEKSFIIQYDGTIKAGIKDLTKADIKEDENTIIVTLPDIEITGTEIDNDSFVEIDESNNIFNPITIEDFNDAQKDLKKKMKKRAKEKGILDLARDNAETIVAEMLKSPDDDYNIEIEWK